jgi:hypothetical protein
MYGNRPSKKVVTVNRYESELQRILQGYDEVQYSSTQDSDEGYIFITTAGHGFLVVPIKDRFIHVATSIVKFGYIGKLAIYLEEDQEASTFLKEIRSQL